MIITDDTFWPYDRKLGLFSAEIKPASNLFW